MKRKVIYDYKLMKSFAFVTQNWDVMKERYVLFCMPFWNKMDNNLFQLNEAYKKLCREGLINRIRERRVSYSSSYTYFTDVMTTMIEMRSKDPITAWFHELDDLNKQLTLQFLIVCAADLPDEIKDFEIEVSPEVIYKKEEFPGEVIGSKINGESRNANPEDVNPF